EMVQLWGGQFCLKGVMAAADAWRAADIGCTGIVVSNHGGRQLDGSRASFDQLAEIVDCVGDRIDVLMDGGIQRGSHVLNTLSPPRPKGRGRRPFLPSPGGRGGQTGGGGGPRSAAGGDRAGYETQGVQGYQPALARKSALRVATAPPFKTRCH